MSQAYAATLNKEYTGRISPGWRCYSDITIWDVLLKLIVALFQNGILRGKE